MALTNIETTITLDLYDHDTTPSTIKAIQLDSNTRYVAAVIRNKGGIYDIGQNTTVTLTVIRPDKVGVQITGSPRAQPEMTPDEQVITTYGAYAELSQAALAVKGTLYAQFKFTSGDQVMRSEIFAINCGEALDASTDTWAGEYQGYNLDELVQNVNSAVATVEGMEQDVSELKSGLNATEDVICEDVKSKNLIDPNALTVGRLGSNGVTDTMSNYRTSDYIPLEAGKTYVFARESMTDPGTAKITGYAGYGFYDTSKAWVANSRVWDNYTDNSNPPVFVITPEADCYIRVCGNKDYFGTDTNGNFILQEGSELDGYEEYFEPYKQVAVLKSSQLVQEAGDSETLIMSQKAVKEFVESSSSGDLDEIAPYVVGKNKYNPTECNPKNSYYYDETGVEKAGGGTYAITGKIPVEEETTYVFSSTEFSTQYMRPCYYSGNDGETFISREERGVKTFTTPTGCTYIGIILFARSHTDDDYNAAIAVAQLELGSVATPYETYSKKRIVDLDNIEDGDSVAAVSDVTTKVSLVNIYDKTLAEDGKYFNGSSGTVVSNAVWAFSGKIPVKPNRQYNISRDPSTPLPLSGVVYCFDANGGRLANASLSNYVYGYLLSFATASDVRYIAFNMALADHTTQDFNDTIDTLMLVEGTQRPLTYYPYAEENVTVAGKNTDAYIENRDCFTAKKWLAIGTSITWYDSKTYTAGQNTGEICRGYVGNVARRKRLLVTNEGISGSTLANVSDSSLINRYQSLDWEGTDIATIEYGVNDFGHAVDIGTAEDAPGTSTFAACLKTVIEYALSQNPKLCLVICTEPDVRGSTANSGGHYLYEYTDVTLAIAKQYRLPVCDWYYHSGINALTKGDSSHDYLTADGTHPNDAGHLRMGAMLNQVFDSLIC